MIRGRHLLAIAIAIAALGGSAAARAERVVDYAIDEARAAQDAVEQGVPLTALPKRGTLHLGLETAPDVDHEVIRAGITCGAWKIRNPLSLLVRRFAVAWDRDGVPADATAPTADLVVRVARASTLSRCVSTGELKTSCIYRVTLVGSVTTRAGAVHPFRVEREATAKGSGICAGMTRGIGLVSRMATAAMLDEAAGFATAPAPSQG